MSKEISSENRKLWVNMMSVIYTSQSGSVTSREIFSEALKAFPGTSMSRLEGVWFRVRRHLLKNKAISFKRAPDGKGSKRAIAVVSVTDRAFVHASMEGLWNNGLGIPFIRSVQAKAPTEPTGVVTRTERIVAALYKRCLEYKQEVAEMVDELAACRASVQDATRKVNATNEAIRRSERVAAEIDLKEVGIDPEGV